MRIAPSILHHEHVQATTTLVSEERADNHKENHEKEKEEQVEQFEPPPISNPSYDKEVSTEAHSFVTIPLETQPQIPSFQCLKEPSYVEIFEELHTQKITNLGTVFLSGFLEIRSTT
jgi:hypothetical protein